MNWTILRLLADVCFFDPKFSEILDPGYFATFGVPRLPEKGRPGGKLATATPFYPGLSLSMQLEVWFNSALLFWEKKTSAFDDHQFA